MKKYINIFVIALFTIIIMSSCQKDDDVFESIKNNIEKEEVKTEILSGTFKSDVSETEYNSNITITFSNFYTYSYTQNININDEITTVTTTGQWKYFDNNHSEIIMTISDNSDNIDIICNIEYIDKSIKNIIINNIKFIKQ